MSLKEFYYGLKNKWRKRHPKKPCNPHVWFEIDNQESIRSHRTYRVYKCRKCKEIKTLHRKDSDFCNKCKIKFTFTHERFLCPYCDRFYCTEHRIPENHSCKGKTIKPESLNKNISDINQKKW